MTATVDDILSGALEYIRKHGWAREVWPDRSMHRPRCIRAALHCAAKDLGAVDHEAHGEALRRVSEAIYDKRGSVGGITDWEHYKRTTQDSVIAVLEKAIEIGPGEKPRAADRLRPV